MLLCVQHVPTRDTPHVVLQHDDTQANVLTGRIDSLQILLEHLQIDHEPDHELDNINPNMPV